MKKEFRVLLIDDNKEVLDNLQAIMQRSISVESSSKIIETAKVTVETLHILMEELPGGHDYQIKDETIEQLATICNQEFDFIISDFAFIADRHKNERLRQQLLDESRPLNEQDLKGWVLHLRDVKAKVNNLAISFPEKYNRINSNFLKYPNIVQVYTNSPEPFSSYFDSYEMPKRISEMGKVFQDAKKVEFILMHDEFSINLNIDRQFTNANERKRFYTLLLSKRLTSLIETIILRHMVLQQRKFLLKSVKTGKGELIKLGLALGAFSALFGEMLFHFLKKPIAMTKSKILDPQYSFDIPAVLYSFATFLILTFLCYKILQRFAVYVAYKTEKIAKNLTDNEDD